MKVYTINFDYFDGAACARIDVDITATSKIQLIKAFISETKNIYQRYKIFETDRQARKCV